MGSFFEIMFIFYYLMHGRKTSKSYEFSSRNSAGYWDHEDGFDHLIEYKNVILNPYTTLEFWCIGGDLNMVSKQPRFNSHRARIQKKGGLNICAQMSRFRPTKGCSIYGCILEYKNITLHPHHNFTKKAKTILSSIFLVYHVGNFQCSSTGSHIMEPRVSVSTHEGKQYLSSHRNDLKGKKRSFRRLLSQLNLSSQTL